MTDDSSTVQPPASAAKKVTAANANPISATKHELTTYISSLPSYLQSIATHDAFKVLKLFADLERRRRVKERLSKEGIPHSLRFKFELTSSKTTKDLPESKALVERAKTALLTFQQDAKAIIQANNDLEILQAEKALYKATIDTIAHLAAAYEAFYKYSSDPQMETMHKYQLFQVICSKEFDIIFANYSTVITGSIRQVTTLFNEHGHLGPGFITDAAATLTLKNAYKAFESIVCKLIASPAKVYQEKQRIYDATQQADKISKEIILGDKANTISEVLDSQPTAPFSTIRSIVWEELRLKGRGAQDGASTKKSSVIMNASSRKRKQNNERQSKSNKRVSFETKATTSKKKSQVSQKTDAQGKVSQDSKKSKKSKKPKNSRGRKEDVSTENVSNQPQGILRRLNNNGTKRRSKRDKIRS